MNYESWTIGKIEASQTKELDQRVDDLIKLRVSLTNSIQDELDFIYDTVRRRTKEGKA